MQTTNQPLELLIDHFLLVNFIYDNQGIKGSIYIYISNIYHIIGHLA